MLPQRLDFCGTAQVELGVLQTSPRELQQVPEVEGALGNERLRTAMVESGLTSRDVAQALGVDAKTVERWISAGRVPHPGNCYQLARLLGVSAAVLWPDRITESLPEARHEEVLGLYSHRAGAPKRLWGDVAHSARDQIDILAYAGLFLPEEHPDMIRLLQEKAQTGTAVRIVLGDPDSPEVALRGEEEGLGEALVGRVRMALAYYKPLADVPGIQFHLHCTTLYNSILRFDDQMLVNLHVYGAYGYMAPLLHLRRIDNHELFGTYAASFDRVWTKSWPINA